MRVIRSSDIQDSCDGITEGDSCGVVLGTVGVELRLCEVVVDGVFVDRVAVNLANITVFLDGIDFIRGDEVGYSPNGFICVCL